MKAERIVKVVIVLIGLGAFAYVLSMHLSRSTGKLAAGGVAVGVAIVWMIAAYYFDRARRQRIEEWGLRVGITVGLPSEAQFVHRMMKEHRNLSALFWASGEHGGEPIGIAEYSFVTGRGKGTQTHKRTQVWRRCPEAWPEWSLSKRVGLFRRSVTKLSATTGPALENPEFQKRWDVVSEADEFSLVLLTPEIQAWMMAAPKHESWMISRGRVCITHGKTADVEHLEGMIARLDEFLSMIPQELRDW